MINTDETKEKVENTQTIVFNDSDSLSASRSPSQSESLSKSQSVTYPNVSITTSVVFSTPIEGDDLTAIVAAYEETINNVASVSSVSVESSLIESTIDIAVTVSGSNYFISGTDRNNTTYTEQRSIFVNFNIRLGDTISFTKNSSAHPLAIKSYL